MSDRSLTETRRFFASDNAAGIHPSVLAAIADANRGHALAYGRDPWTERARSLFRRHFGDDVEVALTFGGTGANIVGIASVLEPYESVICAESAHLWRDECAAPERWLGAKLVPVLTRDGKLRPADIEPLLEDRGIVHRSQPKVVSVSQPTEWGTVYTFEELCSLADFCHANDLLVHVDGARLANAAAALGTSLGGVSLECGVDVLSFGGTKNGLLAGEAVLTFTERSRRGLYFQQKQCAQLPSKTRFIAAQFEALLAGDLWLDNARHSNAMASRIGRAIDGLAGVEIVQPVETNVVFVHVSEETARLLCERFHVSLWRSKGPVLRIMTAFDTTDDEVGDLVELLRTYVA